MPKKAVWIAVASGIILSAPFMPAQEAPKPGLWLVTSATRIQQPGTAPGNFGSQGAAPQGSGLPVCMTRELIDKYGLILPPSLRDCDLSNLVSAADNFRADLACKGSYNGVGSIDYSFTDPDHIVGKIRFVSKTRDTTNARALMWIQDVSAVFQSADCGVIKPRKIPEKPAPAATP